MVGRFMGKASQRKKDKRNARYLAHMDNFIDPNMLQAMFIDQEDNTFEQLAGRERDPWLKEKPTFSPMLRMRIKTLIQYEQLVQHGREVLEDQTAGVDGGR